MLSKNTYSMFPHGGSPSSHPRTGTVASLLGLNGNELFLHHHHHDMLSGHHLAAALYTQDVDGLTGAGYPSATAVHDSPKPSKKDRHSKINTAQGPRDRRVRLSIGVARKFFDLQESLGFDKPSKTLDWLLTKSETAINDVEQMREKVNFSDCEVDNSGEDLKPNNHSKIRGGSVKDSTKESRMKARARARERTREKMSIKNKLNEYSCRNNNGGGHGCDNFSPIQFINKINSSAGSSNVGFLHHQSYEASAATAAAAATEAARNEDLIEESIVIKRKVKHSLPSMLGFQQNLIISSSNYGVVPNPYNHNHNHNHNNNNNNNAAAAENWDNICAILDHHKFINSTSNN